MNADEFIDFFENSVGASAGSHTHRKLGALAIGIKEILQRLDEQRIKSTNGPIHTELCGCERPELHVP